MIYYVTNSILCLAQMLALFLTLTPKHNRWLTFILVYIPFSVAALSQQALSFVNPAVLVFIAQGIFFACAFTCFKEKFRVRLYISVTILIILYLACLIVAPFGYFYGDLDSPTSPVSIAIIVISVLLLTAFTVFYRMKKNDFAFARFSIIQFSITVFAQLICIFGCCALIFNSDKIFDTNRLLSIFGGDSAVVTVYLVAAGVIFIVSDFLLLLLMMKESHSAKLKDELELANYKNELNYDYYKSIESSMEETRKLRHDLANIVQVAYTLVNEGETDASEHILNMLNDSVKNIHIEKYAENNLVNTILSIKAKACREQNITCDFDIDLPAKIGVEDVDICKGFVNLLDNAVSAAALSEEKYIKLKSHTENEAVYIAVLNSCLPDQIKKAKKKSKDHGFGQKILYDIAAAYNGKFTAQQNGNEYRAVLVMQQRQ